MKSLWPMIQAIHRVVTSWQSQATVRSLYKDALSAALDWKHQISAVFAGREGLQSATAMNVFCEAAVRKRAQARPDHPNILPNLFAKVGLLCLKKAARPLSILFQKIIKLNLCVFLFFS
jgi:hypothetical protein